MSNTMQPSSSSSYSNCYERRLQGGPLAVSGCSNNKQLGLRSNFELKQQQLNEQRQSLKRSSAFLAQLKLSQRHNFDNSKTSAIDRPEKVRASSLSPASVLESIAASSTPTTQSSRSNIKQPILRSISPLHLNQSRERVQSFLNKTLYSKSLQQSPPPCSVQFSSDRRLLQSGRHEEETKELTSQTFENVVCPTRETSGFDSPPKKHRFIEEDSTDQTESTIDSTPTNSPVPTNKIVVHINVDKDEDDESVEECASIGSTSSAASFPSISSAGSGRIGIQRPSYDIFSEDCYINRPLEPPSTAAPLFHCPYLSPAKSASGQHPESSTDSENQITPKKRFTPTLKVTTSTALAAVSEEEDEADESRSEDCVVNENHPQEHSSFQNEDIVENVDFEEEEVVFDLGEDLPYPYSTPNTSYSQDLFDSPFSAPECREEGEDERFFVLQDEKNELNKDESFSSVEVATPQSGLDIQDSTMLSFIQNRVKRSNPRSTPDDSTTQCSGKSKRDGSRSLSGLPDLKRRSREVKDQLHRAILKNNHETDLEPSLVESSDPLCKGGNESKMHEQIPVGSSKSKKKHIDMRSPSVDSSDLSSVEGGRRINSIFLLLLEPKSKIFELIQLLYPIRKTTVHDIIKMIPCNSTEVTLSNQTYVGLTRPKKSADPFYDMNLLASSSAPTDGSSRETPSAGIGRGDVIVAIPAGSERKSLVRLAKQILANPHIQELVGKEEKKKHKDKQHKEKKHKKSITKTDDGSGCKSKDRKKDDGSKSKKDKKTEKSSKDSESHKHRKSKSSKNKHAEKDEFGSEEKVPHANEFESGKPLDLANNDFFIPVMTNIEVSHPEYDGNRYELEMQRAIERATKAESDRDFCVFNKDWTLGDNVNIGRKSCDTPSVNSIFPHVDALEAYMIAREERSSSITSRESRMTNVDDDSKHTANTEDDTSYSTGSLENSFNSWSRSFDSSMATRYNGAYTMSSSRMKGTVIDLTLDDFGSVELPSSAPLRHRHARKTTARFIVSSLIFMLLRYIFDTESGLQSPVAVQYRTEVPWQPLGLTGFVYSVAFFAFLLKLQRFLEKKHTAKKQTGCPIMQLAYDTSEILACRQ